MTKLSMIFSGAILLFSVAAPAQEQNKIRICVDGDCTNHDGQSRVSREGKKAYRSSDADFNDEFEAFKARRAERLAKPQRVQSPVEGRTTETRSSKSTSIQTFNGKSTAKVCVDGGCNTYSCDGEFQIVDNQLRCFIKSSTSGAKQIAPSVRYKFSPTSDDDDGSASVN